MLAYTGLETVANLAAEAREPGKNLPRSLFGGIGAAVIVSFAIGIVAISAFPGGQELGTTWLHAPLVGIASALGDAGAPQMLADGVKTFVGLSGVLVLVMVVTTSISGAGRLAFSLGQRDMLPHVFARLNRRTLIAPASILSVAAIAIAMLIVTVSIGSPGSLARRPVQLRRPPHLHRGADRRDQAAFPRAEPRAAVSRARSTSGSAAFRSRSPR